MFHQVHYLVWRFSIKRNAESALGRKLKKVVLSTTEYYEIPFVVFTFGNTFQCTHMEDLLLQQC